MDLLHIFYDVVSLIIIVIMAIMTTRLRKLAFCDQLTELHNTRYLYRQEKRVVNKARKSGSKICFFFVDLDGLKFINDNYSHEIGDKAIQKIASVLKKFFHLNTDLVVRRNKGDEFICVCQAGEKVANIFAEDLQKRLKNLLINTGSSCIYISATVGFYCSAPNYGVFKKIENKADAEMYKRKEKKR